MRPDDEHLEPLTAGSEAAVVAVASLANPVVGVLAAAALGAKEAVTVRRWRRAVEGALATSGKLLDPEDPLTVAIFTRLTLAAAQTAEADKLELLVNAVLSSGPDGLEPDFLQEHFADLIARLSATHVRVLCAIRDHNELQLDLMTLDAASLLRALSVDSEADVDPDIAFVLETVWNQLVAEDLIESDSLGTENAFEADPSRGRQVHGITPKGRRFLRYLTAHPNASQPKAT